MNITDSNLKLLLINVSYQKKKKKKTTHDVFKKERKKERKKEITTHVYMFIQTKRHFTQITEICNQLGSF